MHIITSILYIVFDNVRHISRLTSVFWTSCIVLGRNKGWRTGPSHTILPLTVTDYWCSQHSHLYLGRRSAMGVRGGTPPALMPEGSEQLGGYLIESVGEDNQGSTMAAP